MSCTKEEIERKRLAALEKRKSKVVSPAANTPQSQFSRLSPAIQSSLQKQTLQTRPKNSYTHNNQCKLPNSFHPYKVNLPSVSLSPTSSKIVTGTTYLISEERFEVKPSEFCTPLIDVFKNLPSRVYDYKSRLWNFSLDDYEELTNKILPLRPDIVIGPLPSYVLKILRERSTDPDTIDLMPIEAALRDKLMPFQQAGVRFGIAKGGRCMIADDMGLGKTFQALAIANYFKNNWPLLIVTTSSMRETWQEKVSELLPCVPLVNVVTLSGSKDAEQVADAHTEVVIVSYKTSTLNAELLKKKKFGVVIIDESHYLKSHKAQCTLALTGITKSARRVILLSGTPALSRPAELYTQLSIIEPKLFGSFTEYGKRYCGGKMSKFGWDMSGQSNLAELQILLQKKFLIRRTKEQVLTDVKEKVRESVLLDPSLMKVSKEERKELNKLAQNIHSCKSSEKHSQLLTFFSESARIKIPAVCKYISNLSREETGKFLVFAHHKQVIDAICVTLDELRVCYICITGSTKADTRAGLVDRFQVSPSCRVAVLSITAANSGITLTAAQLVLFAELHWNPGILTQAEARAHRIGQRGGVRARYLLAKGTSDDFMWPMLQHKLNVLNEVGLSKDNFDDTECTVQESSNNILKYLNSPNGTTNKNDYIPGTNIKKSSQIKLPSYFNPSKENEPINHGRENTDDIEMSFLEDEDGDDLLAKLDF